MQIEKSNLRKYYKDLRTSVDKSIVNGWNNEITRRFLLSDEYIKCNTLLCYVSMDIEVDTIEIIKDALNKKTVLCPRCESSGNLMYFYKITSLDDLETGKFNVQEPKESCERVTEFDNNSLCIVPALSYDLNGYRLGFGKGYYDRFLSNFSGVKVGLCYENCILKKLPADNYDEKVNLLITNTSNRRFFDKGKDV